MTEEQLQQIRERWNDCNEGQILSAVGSEGFRQWVAFVAADEQDLLAEVERLREYVTALKSENTNLQDLSDTTLHTAADAVKHLKAENAAMREIVQAVAERDTTWDSDYGDAYCVFCSGEDRHPFYIHEPDCPVTKARAILAQP